jgi:hypothetical protein
LETYIYKPVTHKGPVFLSPVESDPPTITTADGQVIRAVPANQAGGAYFNEGRYQWVFPREVIGLKGATLSFGGESSVLESGGQSYEGSSVAGWRPRDKGSVGGSGGFGGSGANPFPGQQVGEFGVAPFYLGGQFPSPELINYEDIETAPYNFTDPLEFAREFGEFNREELRKANELGRGFALDALTTELEGLRGFVPGSAALKRQETSLDNQFNQAERERQVNATLPGARQTFAEQRGRFQTYAEGGIPDEVQDRALEIGLRSNAADRAAVGGFGASSSVSRSAQDLMTAQERVKLSQYGDAALSKNIAEEANLFLAPTQYSDAGAQVRVMPSLSGSQLQTAARQEIANFSGVPTTTALASQVNQEQFRTTLEQNTRQFNATNDLNAQEFNANTLNNFALTKFGYDVSYAGASAGALQTNINTQTSLAQQQQFQEVFKDFLNKAQNAGTIGAIGQLIGGLLGLFNALGFGNEDEAKNPTGGTPPISPGNGGSNRPSGSQRPPSGRGGDSEGGELPVDNTEFEPGGPDTEGAPPGQGGNEIPTDDTDFSSDEELPSSDDQDLPIGDEDFSETDEDFGGIEPDVGTGEAETFSTRSASTKAFTKGTGIQFRSAQQARDAEVGAQAVEQSTGIYTQPVKGTQKVGYGLDGRARYAAKELAKSDDVSLGAKFVDSLGTVLNPFGLFGDEDRSKLQKIRDASSDVNFIASLSDKYKRGDSKGFIKALTDRYGQKAINELPEGQTKDGVNTAFAAFKLFENWGNMSNGQKALGIASVGIKGYKFATGENLTTKSIIDPVMTDGKLVRPGLTVGQAISLFQSGYNVYALVDNWDEANTLQKIAGGANTAAAIANTAKQMGLLNTTSSGTTAAGAAAGGGGGAGAGGVAAGTGAAESSAATTLGAVAGAAGIALGAKTVYDAWGTGGKEGATAGAIGGATAAAGYYGVASAGYVAWNPYIAAAVVAVSIAGGAAKTGKHEDQNGRDAVRNFYHKNGLMDKNHKVTLADGSEADIGIDGGGDRHQAANLDLLTDNHKVRRKDGKLNAYDIDYTNDLDYASGMAGVTLSRLLAGGTAKNVDQMGGQLGNAALKNVGYGKEMSRENFDKVMANNRAFFAKAGITSKEAAWELAEQGFAEGRWNDLDRVAMHQTINMMYNDDGYETAQSLMSGRHRGLQVAAEDPREPTDKTPGEIPPGDVRKPQPLPRPTFGNNQPASSQQGTPYTGPRVPIQGPTSMPGAPNGQNLGRRLLTREEVIARNAQRYGRAA